MGLPPVTKRAHSSPRHGNQKSLLCLVAALLLGCSGNGPAEPYECTVRVEGRCWSQLGLDGQWIDALSHTEWGLYAGTRENGVYRLDPQRDQWQALGLDHAIPSSILLVPGPTKRLLVGIEPFSDEQTPAAVFASEDQGRTWTEWDGGLAAQHDFRAWASSLAFDPADPNRLFMGELYSVVRSIDGGRTWGYVWPDTSRLAAGGSIEDIVTASDGSGRMWAAGQSSLFSAAILRSDDGGETWHHIDPLPGDENGVSALVPDPRHADGIWAAMGAGLGGVMHSADAGATWRWVLNIWGRGQVYDLTRVDNALFAVTSENFRQSPDGVGLPVADLGFYRSLDWGMSWETIGVPPGVSGGLRVAQDARDGLFIGTASSGVWHVVP